MAEQRFSEKEVGAIIQQAAALQLEGADMSNGATLAQIQEAASELGISAEFIHQAALQLTARKDARGYSFFGAPLNNRISLVVDGMLAEGDTAELTQAIRSTTGRVGTPKQVGQIFEWTSGAEYPIHISFTPRDGKTYIDVTSRFDSFAVLCVLLPMLVSMVAWVAPSVVLGGVGVLLWGAGQLATYLVGRTLFKSMARKKLADLKRTAEYVAHVVGQKSQGSELAAIDSD